MRITPMDIEQQQFSKSFRGYNEEEVDDFLDRIAKDYEDILNDNIKLKEEIEKLQSRLEEYSRMEETLRTALVNAQQSASTIKENVQKETQSMVDNAKIEAEKIKQQARQDVQDITREIETMKKRKNLILEKLKETLKLHIRMLDEEELKDEELNRPEKLEEQQEPVARTRPESSFMEDRSIEDLKMRIGSNEEENPQDEDREDRGNSKQNHEGF